MMKSALGIDIGTSSTKVCLLDKEGQVVSFSTASYPTSSPHPNWMEQNPIEWIKAVKKAIVTLVQCYSAQISDIGSICFTSAAHIAVLLDDEDRPVRNALLWSDQRSINQVKQLQKEEDEIYAISANRVSTSWSLPHLLWVKQEEPEAWKKVKRICLSKDFILHWFTGEWVTDPATAVSSMLFDYKMGTWSSRLLSFLDIQPSQLPIVKQVDEVVGYLLPEISTLLGLPSNVSIVNGSLDSATETYGAGARCPDDVVIRIGTAGGIYKFSSIPMQQRTLLTYPFLLDNLWYSQAGTNAAGSAIGWVTNLQGFAKEKSGFDELDDMASSVDAGSNGVLFHPYLNGERTPYWNSNLRGTFTGLSFMHSKKDIARAVLEGVCFSLKDALLSLMDESEIPQNIVVVGGGAKDSLLMEILSSVLRTPLQLCPDTDSSYGCARIGQLTLNAHESLGMFDAIEAEIVQPKIEWVGVYDESFKRYKKLIAKLFEIYT